MQTVTYNNKEYKIPFDVDLTLGAKDKLIEVPNSIVTGKQIGRAHV